MTTLQKRKAYYLGVLGQEIIKNIFSFTEPGKRSYDIVVPTEGKPRRLEVKTRKLRGGGYFQINFTRYERTHADDFVVLVLDDDFTISRLYWLPRWIMPHGKGYLYFGKKPTKYEAYRLV